MRDSLLIKMGKKKLSNHSPFLCSSIPFPGTFKQERQPTFFLFLETRFASYSFPPPFHFLSSLLLKSKNLNLNHPSRYYYEITQHARFLHLLIPTMTPFPSQIHATRLIRIRFSDLDGISRLAGEGRKCPHYFGF